jgi:putative membrane protein
MIRNFSDHAANERTFLAWVRTSIAVIAFGFLVERFDLFLAFSEPSSLAGKIAVPRQEFGQVAGIVLIVLGMLMIVVSAVRFVRTAKEIDARKEFPVTALAQALSDRKERKEVADRAQRHGEEVHAAL